MTNKRRESVASFETTLSLFYIYFLPTIQI